MDIVGKRSEQATENGKFTVSEEILNFMVMGSQESTNHDILAGK